MNKEEINYVLESLRFKTSIYRDKKKRNLPFNDDEYYSNILIEYIEELHNKIDKVIDVIHTQMKNNPSYKENLKIIEITLIKGSCKVCDLKDGDVDV